MAQGTNRGFNTNSCLSQQLNQLSNTLYFFTFEYLPASSLLLIEHNKSFFRSFWVIVWFLSMWKSINRCIGKNPISSLIFRFVLKRPNKVEVYRKYMSLDLKVFLIKYFQFRLALFLIWFISLDLCNQTSEKVLLNFKAIWSSLPIETLSELAWPPKRLLELRVRW